MSAQLIYCGTVIRDRNEMLCLTDMWRASGSDPSKRPADWSRKEGSSFIEFIAGNLNVPMEHIWIADRGQTGATWAHWQIGMAYAQCLTPEFHAWCNTIVRSHMQGMRTAPTSVDFFDSLFDKKIVPVVDEMRTGFRRLEDNVGNILQFVSKGRRDAEAETVRMHGKVLRRHYDCKCPCLECENTIMDKDGFIPGAWHHHHQNNRNDNRPQAMIPLALKCHQRIEHDSEARTRFGAKAFVMFQTLLERMPLDQSSWKF